jgi:hypothetical protein
MATKPVDDVEQLIEASGAARSVAELCLLAFCAVASCLLDMCGARHGGLVGLARDVGMASGITVYALIVVENMTTKSAGDVKRRREDSGSARSFSGLCLFVLAVVAYLAAGGGALRYIATAVGTTIYALIVVDFFRWRLSWHS